MPIIIPIRLLPIYLSKTLNSPLQTIHTDLAFPAIKLTITITFLSQKLYPFFSQYYYSSVSNYAMSKMFDEAKLVFHMSVLETQYCDNADSTRTLHESTSLAVLYGYCTGHTNEDCKAPQ